MLKILYIFSIIYYERKNIHLNNLILESNYKYKPLEIIALTPINKKISFSIEYMYVCMVRTISMACNI